MADGTGGSVEFTEPGYAETGRGKAGENHMNTDYAQAVKTRETRRQAFDNGRS